MGSKHDIGKLMENRDDVILVPLWEKLEVYMISSYRIHMYARFIFSTEILFYLIKQKFYLIKVNASIHNENTQIYRITGK